MDVREKLIDADALLRDIEHYHVSDGKMQHWVEIQQTVDAVEVMHGRWEEMHYEGGILDGINFDRCSVCGYERVFNDPALKTVFKYCPNCGAKMDGGVDNG